MTENVQGAQFETDISRIEFNDLALIKALAIIRR